MPKVRKVEELLFEEQEADTLLWIQDTFWSVFEYGEYDKENWFKYKHPNMRRCWHW